jgi:hypothetical protein
VISDETKIFLADTDPAEKVVLDIDIVEGSVSSKSPLNTFQRRRKKLTIIFRCGIGSN